MFMADQMFDAHFHIIDPTHPLIPNNGYLPGPFTTRDYLQHAARYGITGGAIVSGSFQGFDQGYLLEALGCLGPGWVGVTQLDPAASDEEIIALDAAGVRAVRFTLARGGGLDVAVARRVHDLVGWHAELYVDAAHLPSLSRSLAELPAFSVDHLGLSEPGLPALLEAVARGARVKATGFGRLDMDITEVLRQIDAIDPQALLFGTDLPGTRAPRAFSPTDLTRITDALGSGALERLSENGRRWYRL